MIPQVTGTDFDAPRRPVMRVTGDAQRALPPDLAKDRVRTLIGADVVANIERDDVRVLLAAYPVLRDLCARDDEHPVRLHRSFGFTADVFEIDAEVPLAARRMTVARAWPRRPARAKMSRFIRM
jgi:hypothetical protein